MPSIPQQPMPSPPSDSAPQIPGFSLIWSDDFNGPAGSPVNPTNWSFYHGGNYNGEIQTYTSTPANISLSGTGALNIIPLRDPQTHTWTSARIHSRHPLACPPGKSLILQSRIRLGSNPPAQQLGMWPAFWALGAGFNDSNPAWPTCGEWDILEVANGSTQNTTTVHTGTSVAAHYALSAKAGPPFAAGDFHVWACRVDRGVSGAETLSFWQDGRKTFEISENQVQPGELWEELARRPVFPVLNVAVGGNFPALSAEEVGSLMQGGTAEGLESGMQVGYVAFYVSE